MISVRLRGKHELAERSVRLTRRGEIVLACLAVLILLVLMSIVGGIERS